MRDKTSTKIIADAMRILARDIQSDDGVANGAIMQAAERLEEQAKEIEVLKLRLEQVATAAQSIIQVERELTK